MIGAYAPFVILARMQVMASETFFPTPRGQRELLRMMSEKPFAAVEVALALQRAAWKTGEALLLDLTSGSAGALSAAPRLALSAAVAPLRRRVRRNAQRLARR